MKNKMKFIKNKNVYIFFHKFKSYSCVFIGKINEIYILIDDKANRETLEFFKVSWDTSRIKTKPGSRKLNPNSYMQS